MSELTHGVRVRNAVVCVRVVCEAVVWGLLKRKTPEAPVTRQRKTNDVNYRNTNNYQDRNKSKSPMHRHVSKNANANNK